MMAIIMKTTDINICPVTEMTVSYPSRRAVGLVGDRVFAGFDMVSAHDNGTIKNKKYIKREKTCSPINQNPHGL